MSPPCPSLIRVNLDAVNALYTDKLPEYFERLREVRTIDGKVNLDSMPEDQQKTPPTGGGWVVELRGYTYHEDQRLFLVNTLFANLLDKAKDNDISHLVLYRYHLDRSPVPHRYHLIQQTDLAQLVVGIKPESFGSNVREPPVSSGQAPAKIDYERRPLEPARLRLRRIQDTHRCQGRGEAQALREPGQRANRVRHPLRLEGTSRPGHGTHRRQDAGQETVMTALVGRPEGRPDP